ncbi:MAG: hypothetical protein GF308_01120 [Candidatus Heimdallarchaeota archaeon]|nr:hypothetical protein [Candidatus Heimdallarchaeota archaeon]
MNDKTWPDFKIRGWIKEPIVILGFLLFINYLFIMILYFNTPVSTVISYTNSTYTEYYWKGYFKTWNADLSSVIDSGFLETFPLAGSWLFVSALILMLIITLSQAIIPIFQSNITRRELIERIIWPNFIGNMLIVSGLLVLIHWSSPARSEDILSRLGPALKYGIILSAVMLIFILIIIAFNSRIYPKKNQIIQEMEDPT